ncbi:universal stress protein [Trinickia soli]|uniref:universal stress protein n=1 Tax=Trinickia soli TaxID=380675 RepID=UPI003FA3786B
MKSILLALEDTPAGSAACSVAIALAEKHAAHVTGLCILDKEFLTAPEPEPIGGAYYKFQLDLARLKRASDKQAALVSSFEAGCRQRNVAGTVSLLDGTPLPEILHAADIHDLIVIGRDTAFHFQPARHMAETVEELLKMNPRPIVVTAPTSTKVDPILVAFDGSVAAARSLQVFTLLHMADEASVHLVSVAASEDEARSIAQRGAGYLQLYGISVQTHAIASSVDPADILLAEAQSIDAGVIVMGAFGHRGWREALLGSCTRRLFEESPMSLFVHH